MELWYLLLKPSCPGGVDPESLGCFALLAKTINFLTKQD
ncbi:hypothetical protein MNBD_NITROSPINAE05-450 [hydrothermal vent metagenome]|uniref:Uncharacterized protein n=1 Tax=hydrothermal vent metagenome TaxID=652676 RepID=A0A3B1D3L6_9ZZZZ